jgi:chromate transporter
MLQGVLASLRPAVVALIFSAGLNMLLQVVFGGRSSISLDHVSWGGAALFAAAFFTLRKFKQNPIIVMLACGACGLVLGLLGVF